MNERITEWMKEWGIPIILTLIFGSYCIFSGIK